MLSVIRALYGGRPATALFLIALDQLVKKLNSKEPFGSNGEVVKALRTAWNDIANAPPGENNDIVKALRTVWDDVTKGLGPNNDVRKLFESLGFKF